MTTGTTETAMSIATLKRVAVKLPPTRSVLIRANHGVGKSKVVRQISHFIRKELGLKGDGKTGGYRSSTAASAR